MEGCNVKVDNEQFIRDCMSREMSLLDIEKKYGIKDVLGKYLEVKKMYSQEYIYKIMNEVYYDFKGM